MAPRHRKGLGLSQLTTILTVARKHSSNASTFCTQDKMRAHSINDEMGTDTIATAKLTNLVVTVHGAQPPRLFLGWCVPPRHMACAACSWGDG